MYVSFEIFFFFGIIKVEKPISKRKAKRVTYVVLVQALELTGLRACRRHCALSLLIWVKLSFYINSLGSA